MTKADLAPLSPTQACSSPEHAGAARKAQRTTTLRLGTISEAFRIYDQPDSPLHAWALEAGRSGFAGGALWMARSLAWLRQEPDPASDAKRPEHPTRRLQPTPPTRPTRQTLQTQPTQPSRSQMHKLGFAKYALAISASLGVAALALALTSPWILLLAPLAFYMVEARFLFSFPLALDGSTAPLRDSHELVHRCGSCIVVTSKVMVVATLMLSGGWLGKGFLRCWSVGCLTVLLWYEQISEPGSQRPDDAPPVRRKRLEIGARQPILCRRETLHTDLAGQPRRVAFLSDLHLRAQSRPLVEEVLAKLAAESPDLILLGGDLLDKGSGVHLLAELWNRLETIAPVLAVPGNHDAALVTQGLAATLGRPDRAWLDEDGIEILRGRPETTSSSGRPLNTDRIPLQVLPARGAHHARADRFTILLAHDPRAFDLLPGAGPMRDQGAATQASQLATPSAASTDSPTPAGERSGIDLGLAGHLHGCQWVFWERRGRLYPGAWFYPWNGLRFDGEESTFLVGRGLDDSLRLRWNCPREILLCTIQNRD